MQAYWRELEGEWETAKADIAFYIDNEPQTTKFIALDSSLVPGAQVRSRFPAQLQDHTSASGFQLYSEPITNLTKSRTFLNHSIYTIADYITVARF